MPFYRNASFDFCILLVINLLNADEHNSDPKPTKATTHMLLIYMHVVLPNPVVFRTSLPQTQALSEALPIMSHILAHICPFTQVGA